MHNTYFTRKRDNARLLLKQDAASASLHNFCVPLLGGITFLSLRRILSRYSLQLLHPILRPRRA